MGDQRKRAAGPGGEDARGAFLPDLTDVDLRTLRAMDDPGLIAAVDRVLRSSARSREMWYGDTDPEVTRAKAGDRTFSVGLADPERGKDTGG
ncbi:MAG: FXSXX-COOH protein [Streptomyces sp.]|nr:FXSXX-COOH protein [Streptomyces sp.]NUS25375.1 FXSXX-COOH protein [Streptomyces sp.]